MFKDFLAFAPPREVHAHNGRPLVIFVDGSCEPGNKATAGVGGIFFDPLDHYCAWFGESVPEAIVDRWQSSG